MIRRRMLLILGLMAMAAAPLYPAAGALEVKVPAQKEQCKVVEVPANVDIGAFVQKQITLAGIVLNANVNQKVLVVEKRVLVEICVATEGDVVVKADLLAGVNGDVHCPEGAVGVAVHPRLNVQAGTKGGALIVRVRVGVTDRDEVLGIAFDDTKVVIEENKRLVIPPLFVEDMDGADADVCVGPVLVKST